MLIAPFFSADRSFGTGVCFHDSFDTLLQACALYFPHVAPVVECEVLTLLVALKIAVESDYTFFSIIEGTNLYFGEGSRLTVYAFLLNT
jgi:hypothetical protein